MRAKNLSDSHLSVDNLQDTQDRKTLSRSLCPRWPPMVLQANQRETMQVQATHMRISETKGKRCPRSGCSSHRTFQGPFPACCLFPSPAANKENTWDPKVSTCEKKSHTWLKYSRTSKCSVYFNTTRWWAVCGENIKTNITLSWRTHWTPTPESPESASLDDSVLIQSPPVLFSPLLIDVIRVQWPQLGSQLLFWSTRKTTTSILQKTKPNNQSGSDNNR